MELVSQLVNHHRQFTVNRPIPTNQKCDMEGSNIDLLFKSTAFFPKPKQTEYDMSKQQQCLHTGMPVFAKDILDGGKKTYFACGYEHFCNVMYRNPNIRNVYELLQYEKPSKIYVDFDCDNVSKAQQFEDEFNGFCNKMKEVIGIDDVPIYVLDACTDKKLSRHVIFEFFLENIPVVQNVVEHALSLFPCEFVDRGVYTRNRVFRLLYSHKLGKDKSTALRINGTRVDAPYNPEHVFRTMIQAMVPPHYVDGSFCNLEGLCKSIKQVRLNNNTQKRYHGNGYSGTICNLPPLFAKAVQEYGGVILSARENDHFISCIVGGKKCPWTDRVHKNNNQYFTICKSNLKGFWTCSDPECENIQYEEVDWSYLWRKCFI